MDHVSFIDKVERRGLEKGRMEDRDESILTVHDIVSMDELVKRFHVAPEYIENLLKNRDSLSQ